MIWHLGEFSDITEVWFSFAQSYQNKNSFVFFKCKHMQTSHAGSNEDWYPVAKLTLCNNGQVHFEQPYTSPPHIALNCGFCDKSRKVGILMVVFHWKGEFGKGKEHYFKMKPHTDVWPMLGPSTEVSLHPWVDRA